MMVEFLSERKLSDRIKEVCEGDDLKAAVAFIGEGSAEALFKNTGAKIICDISMASTNPKELKKLNAPKNKNIRHIKALHTKVYLSKKGVVVCSANASENGVGFVGEANRGGPTISTS